jgi:hypothetical protein
MAVVPPPRASTRGKAAARPLINEYPKSVIGLIYAIVDDDRRTRNCMRLVVLVIVGCCVVIYTWIAATKGVHALTWRLLLPGGLFGGGTLTYAVNALKQRVVRRRAVVAAADSSTTGRSPEQSHTQARPEGTPGQAQ